jgi:hypothetical protein
MMPHVVSTLGWLPDPLARSVGRFFLRLPDTPDVIKLRCFLKNLPPLIIHINSSDSHCALMNVEIIGASCLATGLPSRSSFSLIISFSSRVRAHPIGLVVNHLVVSSGWERRSVLISGMVYTTSPPHVSSPRPTYRGCAGDIRTPYIHLPHSTPSSSSSSDSGVTSLAATFCPWAARGRLARGLGVLSIRLRTFLVTLAEARFASFPVTHRAHMASSSLFHSFRWK